MIYREREKETERSGSDIQAHGRARGKRVRGREMTRAGGGHGKRELKWGQKSRRESGGEGWEGKSKAHGNWKEDRVATPMHSNLLAASCMMHHPKLPEGDGVHPTRNKKGKTNICIMVTRRIQKMKNYTEWIHLHKSTNETKEHIKTNPSSLAKGTSKTT